MTTSDASTLTADFVEIPPTFFSEEVTDPPQSHQQSDSPKQAKSPLAIQSSEQLAENSTTPSTDASGFHVEESVNTPQSQVQPQLQLQPYARSHTRSDTADDLLSRNTSMLSPAAIEELQIREAFFHKMRDDLVEDILGWRSGDPIILDALGADRIDLPREQITNDPNMNHKINGVIDRATKTINEHSNNPSRRFWDDKIQSELEEQRKMALRKLHHRLTRNSKIHTVLELHSTNLNMDLSECERKVIDDSSENRKKDGSIRSESENNQDTFYSYANPGNPLSALSRILGNKHQKRSKISADPIDVEIVKHKRANLAKKIQPQSSWRTEFIPIKKLTKSIIDKLSQGVEALKEADYDRWSSQTNLKLRHVSLGEDAPREIYDKAHGGFWGQLEKKEWSSYILDIEPLLKENVRREVSNLMDQRTANGLNGIGSLSNLRVTTTIDPSKFTEIPTKYYREGSYYNDYRQELNDDSITYQFASRAFLDGLVEPEPQSLLQLVDINDPKYNRFGDEEDE